MFIKLQQIDVKSHHGMPIKNGPNHLVVYILHTLLTICYWVIVLLQQELMPDTFATNPQVSYQHQQNLLSPQNLSPIKTGVILPIVIAIKASGK